MIINVPFLCCSVLNYVFRTFYKVHVKTGSSFGWRFAKMSRILRCPLWKGFPDETPCVHFSFCLFKIAILFRKLCNCIM